MSTIYLHGTVVNNWIPEGGGGEYEIHDKKGHRSI